MELFFKSFFSSVGTYIIIITLVSFFLISCRKPKDDRPIITVYPDHKGSGYIHTTKVVDVDLSIYVKTVKYNPGEDKPIIGFVRLIMHQGTSIIYNSDLQNSTLVILSAYPDKGVSKFIYEIEN